MLPLIGLLYVSGITLLLYFESEALPEPSAQRSCKNHGSLLIDGEDGVILLCNEIVLRLLGCWLGWYFFVEIIIAAFVLGWVLRRVCCFLILVCFSVGGSLDFFR